MISTRNEQNGGSFETIESLGAIQTRAGASRQSGAQELGLRRYRLQVWRGRKTDGQRPQEYAKGGVGISGKWSLFNYFFKHLFKDSDDDDVSNVDIDKQIEQIFNSKKSVKETMVGQAENAADSKSKILMSK